MCLRVCVFGGVCYTLSTKVKVRRLVRVVAG